MDKIAFQRQIERHRDAIQMGQIETSLQALLTWELELEDKLQIAELCSDIVLIALIQSDLEMLDGYLEKLTRLLQNEKDLSTRLKGFLGYEMTRHKQTSTKGYRLLSDCIEEAPTVYELRLLRAFAFHFFGEHTVALFDLEHANQLSKNNILVLSMMGDCNYYLDKYVAAEQLHRQALKLNPDFRRSLICMGLLLLDTQRATEAGQFFLRLIGPEPMNWFSHGCVADILFECEGKSFQSLPYYATAIVSGHIHVATCFNLASGFIALGKYREAYRVLDLCKDKRFKSNKKSDLKAVYYIQMALDIAIHPKRFNRSKILTLSSALKLSNSKILQSLLLLSFEIHALDYLASEAEIIERFAHIIPIPGAKRRSKNNPPPSSYELIIENYLENKSQRAASQEELLLIIMITRGLLWSGFINEAKLMIQFLVHSQDAYASDAGHILLQEFYEHEAATRRSGIMKQELYEYFLQAALSQTELCSKDKNTSIETAQPNNPLFSRTLCKSSSYDFVNAFFDFEFTELCEQALSENTSSTSRLELVSKYSQKISTHQNKTSDKSESISTASETPEDKSLTTSFLNALFCDDISHNDKEAAQFKIDKSKKEQHILKDFFVEENTLLNEVKESDWKAFNDDSTEYDDGNALGFGEGPLPFAIDGSAFRRHLPPVDYNLLDLENAAQYFHRLLELPIKAEIQKKRLFSQMPPVQAETLMSVLSQAIHKRCEQMWRNLHGEDLAASTDKLVDELSLKVLENFSLKHPVVRFYRLILEQANDVSPVFPQSPLLSTPLLCQKQEISHFPQSSQILRQVIPFNRLTFLDLLEAFFNRAVFALEAYNEKKNPKNLSVFFESLSPFKWRGLDDKKEIETCHALGEEISKYFNSEVKNRPLSALQFERGYEDNFFARQFFNWAQEQAKTILPQCMKLEHAIRNNSFQDDFVIFHQAQTLLKAYPYLSRLYLVVAGLYVRMDKKTQVLKLLQKGLKWEDRLYRDSGHWQALSAQENGLDKSFDFQYHPTEIGESAAIWHEILYSSADETLIYHFVDIDQRFKIRKRALPAPTSLIARESLMDKGGCYEFYRLFKNYIHNEDEIYTAFSDCLITDGIYSLENVIMHCLKVLSVPELFPFRHQLAEYLQQIYPKTGHSALAYFYSENMQAVNAFIHASYAYFSEVRTSNEVPEHLATHIASVLYDIGYLDDATTYLDEALAKPQPPPMAYLTRACVAIEMGEFEKAVEILRTGISRNAKSDRFYYNIGLALIELERYDEAEAYLKKGLELADFALDIEIQLIRAYLKSERYLDAINTAKRLENKSKAYFLDAIENLEFTDFRKLKAIQDLIKR